MLDVTHAGQGETQSTLALRIAMVTAFGTRKGGYFSDVLLGLLCSDARTLGHDATMVRVYYDGTDGTVDADVSARLAQWLVDQQIDLVVADRVLSSEPFAQWKARRSGGRMLLLPPPEGMGPVVAGDAAIGYRPYERRSEHGEMGDEVRRAFAMWLDTGLASPRDVDIPGLSAVHDGQPEPPARSLIAASGGPRLDYRPVVECEVIAAAGDVAIPPTPYAVFGNGGCPYSRDVGQAAPYRDLALPKGGELLRKGCAFCTMGGDYDKRPDDDTVASVLRQVAYLTEHLPKPHAFVLTDQHPLRYLTLLLESAERHGVRDVTWLLETRADWLVEHRDALVKSIAIAGRTGMRLELYLMGFESFSDEDLELFNKGTTCAGLLAAVELARELARAHPDHFGFTRERGHSLILFHPWTSPERLLASGETLRAHGLSDFFHDMTRNRLRLYPRLPIFALAKAHGLAVEAWEGDEASRTARAKGYSVDIAWRFADPRAALAYEACRRLRGAFGDETEISQLLAVARWVEQMDREEPPAAESMRGLEAAVGRLATCFGELLHGSRGQRAAPVFFAGACNNGCHGCENRDRFLPDDVTALGERVDQARGGELPLMLAGREPTLHPDFVALVERARGGDGRRVGVTSNGRRFAYRRFTEEAIRAGLSDASIKVFAARPAEADAVARVEGAFLQAMAGIDNLVRGGVRVEIRLPLHARALGTLPLYPELARAHRVGGIRLEVALDSLGLDALEEAAAAVRSLAEGCRAADVHLTASPLPSGMRGFDRLPSVGAMHATDIPRIDPVEPARFERDYRRPRRPVVMRGLVPESELRRWSFTAMAAEFRDLTVATHVMQAGAVTADPRRGVQTEPRVLPEILAQLGADGAPSLYMMARLQELPAAWRERITTPPYCAGAPWLASKVWLSPAGSVTMTHRDAADNLHVQLLGSKRFTLFDATQSAGLYPNSVLSSVPHGCKVDPEAPDLERYPRFRDARADRTELAPGDGIYIPRGTWHHVRTMADSLSVNFWWARGARLPLVAGAALFKRLRRIG